MEVVKRNGAVVPFDMGKILKAIQGAFEDVDEAQVDNNVFDMYAWIESTVKDSGERISVEEIQDIVEEALMLSGYTDVARAYIKYRYQHELARKNRTEKNMAEKLLGTNIENQNANVDEHSFGGRIGEASRVITKEYALYHCMSEMSRNNHLNNEIYIHDLDSYAVGCHNCLSIPFDDLLANGFNTRQTDVRPANSINAAFQLCAVLFQLQSLMEFGGVAATHIDWTMVPYVRKSFYKHFIDGMKYCEEIEFDKAWDDTLSIDDEKYKLHPKAYRYALDKTTRETYQAVEGMYHNLNTLQSRSGNQLPFTSVNYGTCTLPEGRMVTKALLEVSIHGLGKLHKTSIFPNV